MKISRINTETRYALPISMQKNCEIIDKIIDQMSLDSCERVLLKRIAEDQLLYDCGPEEILRHFKPVQRRPRSRQDGRSGEE